ncbi:metallophosphoesterase family protein [Burkholderia pseudomallei]|uniref:metallophosphoesterase family protein n=1 Tax=Burkholderia pseudomallei TaxID=28450 RepID=UPI000537C95B|nr:DNA repair exonuclease [Burkholderia pseudomallei]KGX39742.1 calcineurin-like phosphoesterase family protein [Burkholderia pseudomallei MSHR2138]
MVRILHTADWQIGKQFGQFGAEEAALLNEARLETVKNVAALASGRNVDAVLVAGDVFDQQTVSDTVIRRLFGALTGYSGPWVLLPGNHDAALAESVWSRAARLGCIPANVRVVIEPGVLLLEEVGLAILAAPLTQRNTYDDVTAFFDHTDTPESLIRVGLAHGSVTGRLPDSADSANPIAANRAQTARLDYLALGDWHGMLSIDERTWYAGTPEPDRFKGNEPGFVLDVSIMGLGQPPTVTPVRVAKHTWDRWDALISVPSDVEVIEAKLAELTERNVLQIVVQGSCDLTASESIERAIEEARARVRALRSDTSELRLAPTEAELAQLGAQGGYLAKAVERLKALQEDPEHGAAAHEALLLLARFQRERRAMQ